MAAPASAVAYPPWVMFERYCTESTLARSSSIADTNTLARCRTTSGHPINVSLCLAAPPETSRVCVQLPADVEVSYARVLAAHGDSVLVQVGFEIDESTDHFVYNAGDAAAEPPRPPSLSLLAPHYLHTQSTGLLRRGEDEFLVAELRMEGVTEGDTTYEEPALHLLRSGSGEWCVKRPEVRRYGDAGGETLHVNPEYSWRNSMVIAVGDQKVFWVDLAEGGLLFSDDVFDESPSLWVVPFPEDAANLGERSMGVTADGSTIKFVNVFPRCCCGGAGTSCCLASFHAYAVHTWTLRMDDMTWAMDARLDATQLWSLHSYKRLPRARDQLYNPVVSMDEPDAISFVVCEEHPKTTWRIMVDMRSKTLRSVFRYPEEGQRSWGRPLPSRVSRYFNSKPSSGQPGAPSAAQAEATLSLTNKRVVNKPLHRINTVQGASASPEAAIFAALQAIPGLDRDDLLKAYHILTHDNSGCRLPVQSSYGAANGFQEGLCADGDQG